MKSRITAILVASVIVAVGFVVRTKPTYALTLVPPTIEYNVQAGQTVEPKVKLYNEQAEPVSVFASTANFEAKDEEGSPNFLFEDTPTDLASWIDFPQGSITVQPNQRLEVPVKINIPADAEPGGHYASLFFGTDPSLAAKEGGQVNIQSLIGTLVIIRVEGDVRESASISDFKAEKGSYSRLPVKFSLRLQNTGNVHFKPQGTVTITNLFGGETARLTMNESNGAVLPNSVRRFDVLWHKKDMTGKPGGFMEELKNEWNNFALGTYTATAVVTYGQSKLTLQDRFQMTIMPWRLLTVIIVLIVLFIVLLVMGIKSYNTAIIRRAQGPATPPKQSKTTGTKS